MLFSWNKAAVIFEFCNIILYSSANLSKFLCIILSIFYLLHFCIYFIFFKGICCGIIYFTLLINLFYTNFSFHVSLNFAQFCLITLLHLFEEVLSFSWLKVRQNVFVLYLSKVSLTKYIRYKNTQTKCGKPFYKKVACMLFLFHNTLIGYFV